MGHFEGLLAIERYDRLQGQGHIRHESELLFLAEGQLPP